jgi:hypothetical protein
MEELENNRNQEKQDVFFENEIISSSIHCGKKTYFFDVKMSRKNIPYLTITESQRRFNETTGVYFQEKHKLYLWKDDLEDFQAEVGKIIHFFEQQPQLTQKKQNEDKDFTFEKDDLE